MGSSLHQLGELNPCLGQSHLHRMYQPKQQEMSETQDDWKARSWRRLTGQSWWAGHFLRSPRECLCPGQVYEDAISVLLFQACQYAVLSVRTMLCALPGYCLRSGQFQSTRNSKIMRDTRQDQKHSSRKPRLLWFVVFKFGTCHYTSWNTQKNWQYTWPAWASSRRKEPVIRSKALMQPCMATCQNNCDRRRQLSREALAGFSPSHTTKTYMISHIRCMVSFSMLLIFMLITLFKN